MDIFKAIENGDLAHVKFFIKEGIDVNLKDRHDRTPLFCASKNGYFEIVKFLLVVLIKQFSIFKKKELLKFLFGLYLKKRQDKGALKDGYF